MPTVCSPGGLAVVQSVVPKGWAHKAGVKPGDIVDAVNGKQLTAFSDLGPLLASAARPASIVFLRRMQRPASIIFPPEPSEAAVPPPAPVLSEAEAARLVQECTAAVQAARDRRDTCARLAATRAGEAAQADAVSAAALESLEEASAEAERSTTAGTYRD